MALTDITLQLAPRTDGSQLVSDPAGEIDPQTLEPVSNFRVTENGTTSQILEWEYDLSLHDGFELEASVTGDTDDFIPLATIAKNDRQYISQGLPSNTLIFHRIRAYAS